MVPQISDVSLVLSYKSISNSCWTKKSIILHCHMLKLFVMSYLSLSLSLSFWHQRSCIVLIVKGFVNDSLDIFLLNIIGSTKQLAKSLRRTNSNAQVANLVCFTKDLLIALSHKLIVKIIVSQKNIKTNITSKKKKDKHTKVNTMNKYR